MDSKAVCPIITSSPRIKHSWFILLKAFPDHGDIHRVCQKYFYIYFAHMFRLEFAKVAVIEIALSDSNSRKLQFRHKVFMAFVLQLFRTGQDDWGKIIQLMQAQHFAF